MTERDLSAFRAPPRAVSVPAPPPPASPTRSGPAGQASTRPARPRRRPEPAPTSTGRRKVVVSLPARVHRALRSAAEAENCYKADVVMTAFRSHGPELRRRASGARGGRRRSVEDPTQCHLYLNEGERQELDGLANELSQPRSALVTYLLEAHLA